MIIESKDNKHFKEFRKLITVDGVRKYGKAIVSGKKLIREIAQSAANRCVSLITFERYVENDSEIKNISKRFSDSDSLYTLKKHLYNELDTFNTNAPLLVIQIPEIPEWDYSLAEGCNLLIPFQDPANVGTVIRSAAGFGVHRIIMLKEAAHPFHPKSIRASSGAIFKYTSLSSPSRMEQKGRGKIQMQLFSGPSISKLKYICDDNSLKIISLDMAGEPIQSFRFPNKFLLLPGLEGQGVPEELKATSISVPISERIESLNAAIATSIALFACRHNVF